MGARGMIGVMAITPSGEVQQHAEHANSAAQDIQDARAAHAAGEAAAQARQAHHMQTAQQGYAGDLAEAPSTLQSYAPPGPEGGQPSRSTL